MSEGVPYADILILALIAAFILLRLRSMLGKNDDDTSGYFNRSLPQAPQPPEPIIQLDEKSLKPKTREEADPYLATITDTAIVGTLEAIKAKDPAFTATLFMQGAKMAFEMVFDAFIKGDRQTLKRLLSDALFQEFAHELDKRDSQENKQETTLISVTAKDIVKAQLERNIAQLAVFFASEQVTVTRNAKGEIIEGNPSERHHVEDHWVFERDVTSKNPNWRIIET